MTKLLPPDRIERLAAAPLTYDERGATRRATLPPGYRHARHSAVIGTGLASLNQAADRLFGWELQRRAGVGVAASSERVREGAVALLTVGPKPLALRAPVRVVWVEDEPTRKAFAYGTLPGHPMSGEECFVVRLDTDDRVVLKITAFSRPAGILARLAGPVASRAQEWTGRRYVRGMLEPDRGGA